MSAAAMMADKVAHIVPEITLGIGACVCMTMGLLKQPSARKATGAAAFIALLLAGLFVFVSGEATSTFAGFVKLAVAGVGLLLLMQAISLPESWQALKQAEDPDTPFEPGNTMRGEYFAFFLFSLAGVMLCGGAGDLVWLFLALELTSLPTYIMVATSREKMLAQESGVKYFFLGALAVAIFLYGFAMIYGATGSTTFTEIQAYVATHGASPLLKLGVALAVVGISFKIAAFPMHFYAADVYQGAATPVTTFLAFVPKTAGFVSLILIVGLVGWPLSETAPELVWLLWIMAAATMTLGNVLGLLQSSVKRMLAYSSIAHSGYMLIGIIAGTTAASQSQMSNGLGGVLFYLVAYGLANLGAFAVLASLRHDGEEAETYDDLSGLRHRHPGLAVIMGLSMLSLIGLPPAVGFIGKMYLFGPAINAELTALVVIAVLNSAISAVYYLRVVQVSFFGEANEQTQVAWCTPRVTAAWIAALLALLLGFAGGYLVDPAGKAARQYVGGETSKPTSTADAAN